MAGAFADSKGRYGYRRIKAVLKTGVSEKSVRRIMAEEGLVAVSYTHLTLPTIYSV